ncbi:MAG TPA: hypothetical protein VKA85_07535 [Candidatus Limnocylindrales bacterium]|nr:hypothetical protein [Candidatus Limnocylindrales bacterium]
MAEVAVRIFHPQPGPDAGPLERLLATARAAVAESHRVGFAAAGATDVEIVSGQPDGISFGARLRELVRGTRASGVVVLGSGAMPLATPADRRAFVRAASAGDRQALANNRHSADAVAISCAEALRDVPDLPSDNALPRWLDEVGGYRVRDLRGRWRLGIDLDSPLDCALLGDDRGELTPVRERLAAIARVAADPRAELMIAGRTNAATLAWLERHSASRTRAFVEERGLRAASQLAKRSAAEAGQRPPRSLLGALLDREGPGAIGGVLGELANAALVDTRVLLAHRLGADERSWPTAEDRFASDVLAADAIRDPWLRQLTTSAAGAAIPIVLGGHTLVGPGARLAVAGPRRRGRRR